ncbi:unnamed protein product, partial [Closterium sp. NIES-54]
MDLEYPVVLREWRAGYECRAESGWRAARILSSLLLAACHVAALITVTKAADAVDNTGPLLGRVGQLQQQLHHQLLPSSQASTHPLPSNPHGPNQAAVRSERSDQVPLSEGSNQQRIDSADWEDQALGRLASGGLGGGGGGRRSGVEEERSAAGMVDHGGIVPEGVVPDALDRRIPMLIRMSPERLQLPLEALPHAVDSSEQKNVMLAYRERFDKFGDLIRCHGPPCPDFASCGSAYPNRPMPMWQRPMPMRQHPMPMRQHPMPMWQRPMPMRQRPMPMRQHPIPMRQHPIPMRQHPMPMWQHPMPMRQHPMPMRQHPMPMWQRPMPMRQHPIPMRQHPMPMRQHPMPLQQHPIPMWQHPIPMRQHPISMQDPCPDPHAPCPVHHACPVPCAPCPMPQNSCPCPVFRLHDVMVTHKGFVFNATHRYVHQGCKRFNPFSYPQGQKVHRIKLAFDWGYTQGNNFYHFLVEAIPSFFVAAAALPNFRDIPIIAERFQVVYFPSLVIVCAQCSGICTAAPDAYLSVSNKYLVVRSYPFDPSLSLLLAHMQWDLYDSPKCMIVSLDDARYMRALPATDGDLFHVDTLYV